LNLAELPEDKPSNTVIKPIALKNRASSLRPSTPMKTFRAKDPSVLPPTPSPKKAESSAIPTKTPLRGMSPSKTTAKLTKEGARGPTITTTKIDSKASRPPTAVRQSTTQVKEFKFASDARSRRITRNSKATTEKKENRITPTSSQQHNNPETGTCDADRRDDSVDEEVDEGLALRTRAHEIGKASILAWGETQGRYLD
jgi:hypothetical protein